MMARPAAESAGLLEAIPENGRSASFVANSGTWRMLLLMCAIGFLLRLAVAAFLYKEFVDPYRDFWHFGWETGRIARAIAAGHGFSSPLFGDTGPTAIMTPLYPYLLGGIFKVFGIYSTASAFVILGLNSLFSALTCVPIFFIAEKFFGRRIATWSAWVWVFFPYAIYFSAGRIWVTSLAALLLTVGLLATVRLTPRTGIGGWIGYGVLWALNGLANPANLAVLPFLAVWLMYGFRGHRWRWMGRAALSAIVFAAVISPWFVRNHRTFGGFMPFRDNFWYEFWAGNTGDTSDLVPDWAHPSNGEGEMQKYREMGELRYFDSKKPLVLQFIREHPGSFVRLTAKKFLFTWTGFWSLNPTYLAGEPFEIPNTVFCTAITLVMLVGLFFAFRENVGMFFSIVLFSIPLLYYFTHPDLEYRHVIDPEIVILAALGTLRVARRKPF
jgi:Dolichyl-phosphate-mannose-protein mannosyltransferase